MPGIVGPFKLIMSSMAPVEGHAAHLRHLSSTEAARHLLQEKFGRTRQIVKESDTILSAHVGQALQFHEESLKAPRSIRPMLQYYCYLNLAVAVVVAYRPPNFHRYRQHGVEDKSHLLTTLNLRSVLVRAKRGAIPLFHSLISGESIEGWQFRLNELVGCIPLVRYELNELFGVPCECITAKEAAVKDDQSGLFYSQISFHCSNTSGSDASLTKQRVEKAMPDLARSYRVTKRQRHMLVYRSQRGWQSEKDALHEHKEACIRLINFGGHLISQNVLETSIDYMWHGIARKPLLPTLSAALLLSFGLASICRYRPGLAKRVERSEVNLLLDIFVAEADAIVLPAMRNLLYREEVVISSMGI